LAEIKFPEIKNVYFVGIGGVGMSGLAELLFKWGFSVSGSDLEISENTIRLKNLGIPIAIGHSKENVSNLDLLVHTSATNNDNPELVKARELSIPIIKRAEMLGQIMNMKKSSIGVSGTHGKTTTTSMLSRIFEQAKLDPITIVGGVDRTFKSTVRLGKGDVVISEADEYDHSFLKLKPTNTIVTSIDCDHLDDYGTLKNIKNSFIKYINSIDCNGFSCVCTDDQNIQSIIPNLKRKVITYGINYPADIMAEYIRSERGFTIYDLKINNKIVSQIRLKVPGEHNIYNSLGAICVALEYGISIDNIQTGISNFNGVERRFQVIEENDKYVLIDDYAHHPVEITATLKAAKINWKNRVIAVFQPHLFSRTKFFYKEFARSLQIADVVVILGIYPAREKPITGVTGRLIYDELRNNKHSNVYYEENKFNLARLIDKIKLPQDKIITMGAGDVWQTHGELLKILK